MKAYAKVPQYAPKEHPAVSQGRMGVLLTNLGTPDATDYWSMRRYLKEFLSDPRVIEAPRWLWWIILNGIILTIRPFKSGAAYDRMWDYERGDSPLRLIAQDQVAALKKRFEKHTDIEIDYGMRYGNPSIEAGIDALKQKGCDKILFVPLYPHYSAATTATANDKAFDVLKKMRWQPAVRTVPPYYDMHEYVKAIAQSVKDGVQALDFKPDLIITSYHGVPLSYLKKGDPYHCQCHKTTRLVREHLGWEKDKLMVCFQSRFGPEEWLQPYLDKTLEQLPEKGIKKLAVIAPGFSVDCLETIDEIGNEGKQEFIKAGGTHFAYVPCLNATGLGIDLIEKLVCDNLAGWVIR